MFQELNRYIAALSQILEALKTNLDGRNTRLSDSQIACLQKAKPTLEGCDLACKDFKTKMEGLTIHSHDGRRSFRDSIKLHFQNKSIADFQMRLAGWKESLALALDVALLTSMSANTETFKALEIKIAADRAMQTTGHSFRNNKVLGKARAIYGNVGQIPAHSAAHSYNGNSASGKARVVMGNIDGANALNFMK